MVLVSVWALSVSWLCVCVLYLCVPSVRRSSLVVLLAASCVCLEQDKIKIKIKTNTKSIDEMSDNSGSYLSN